jgi:hypothetical protein
MVRREPMNTEPRVGERVIFPFGVEEQEGEVYRVEGTGEHTYVTVEYYLHGSDEPLLTTFPLKWIKPAQVASDVRGGGAGSGGRSTTTGS